jgi:hypothetical protein
MTISKSVYRAFVFVLITTCLAGTWIAFGQTTSVGGMTPPSSTPPQGKTFDLKPWPPYQSRPKVFAPCPGGETQLQKIFLDRDMQIGTRGVPPSPVFPVLMGRTHMGLDWQRDFLAVVMDMMNGDLYWYDYMQPAGLRLVKMPKGREFFPAAYTKEKMLLVICNAHFNTSAGVTPTNIAVSEATAEIAAAAAAPSATVPTVAPPTTPGTGATPAITPGTAPAAPPSPGGGHGHAATNFSQFTMQQIFTQFDIPERSVPSDEDTQKVVDAIQKYLATYTDTHQKIDVLNKRASDIASKEASDEQKIRDIETKSSCALAETAKAAADCAMALDANRSLIFSDAVNDAAAVVRDNYPANGGKASSKLSEQVAKLSSDYSDAKFNTLVSSLNDQYKAIFDAITTYANSTPDVKAIENLLKTVPLTAAQQTELQSERQSRIQANQDKIKSAAIGKVQAQYPEVTSVDSMVKPAVISRDAGALVSTLNALKNAPTVLSSAIKHMADKLNDDYVHSYQNIVIPVPNVSSNSLQLFSLTVTDNYKPLVWTEPTDTNTKSQNSGSACPSACPSSCPSQTCATAPPASSPSPAPAANSQTAGVGLQVTAIKPGAPATLSSSPVQVSEQVDGTGNVAITASFIVPFHRIVNFAAAGGFLYARIPSNMFTAETFPESIVTTTTTTATSSTGVTTISTTVVPTTSTTTFAFQSQKQPYQTAGILGINWYPFGRDSFAVSKRARFFDEPATRTYSRHTLAQNLVPGVLVATAVNTAGTFVVAPEWDIFPGVSLFGGLTLADKTSLSQNVVLCNSPGTTVSTIQYGTTTPPPPGQTVTSVQVQTTTGCANANATQLSGTTVPTVTGIAPGFGFGIVFNSSLFGLFAGKN